MLVPLSALHESVRDKIVTLDIRFGPTVNNLFVCREHIKEVKSAVGKDKEYYGRKTLMVLGFP